MDYVNLKKRLIELATLYIGVQAIAENVVDKIIEVVEENDNCDCRSLDDDTLY